MTNYKDYIYILINKNKALIFLMLLTSTAYSQSQEVQLANEYLLKGDKTKALEMYRDLARNERNVPLIHNNYINLLLDQNLFGEAQDYLKRIQKREPSNLTYQLDLGIVYTRAGDPAKADKHLKEIIASNKSNVQSLKIIADYLSSRSLPQYAILSLKEGRSTFGNPNLFSLELAMLYRITGEKDKMVQEYLAYVTQSSANIQYVKNVMQALLTKPDELESLERLLYDKVQQSPDSEVYSDLLIWVTMQQKNFYASFIQARAYDKRYKREGDKSMEVARVALNNEDYATAAKIYRYVAKEYPQSQNYLNARLGIIQTREAQIKNSYPVNVDSVAGLVQEYRRFIETYPDNTYSLEASRNLASLYATYLGRVDEAIALLDQLISNPRTTQHLRSKAKLDLGDIYLSRGEPWESALLYAQVEKIQRENPIGYEAKLKNAKLSYFKGDFRLAQEHLDILKEATTREIANDAMELSMLIKENLLWDSTGAALKAYAGVELLLYQNKTEEALNTLKNFAVSRTQWMSAKEADERNLVSLEHKGDSVLVKISEPLTSSPILDNVYWLTANIEMQQGSFQEAIASLDKILEQYGDDVLADDAFFLKGEIYERQLQDKGKAMEIYREFLNKFPGSVFSAEARKRFRTLRGDFNDDNVTPDSSL